MRKTIESVISQTFTDFEYIIIDGGSTDGSVEIIKQYADKITYWVSEPDKGIYNAMNKGILQAKGEYCQFLNSGDTLYSNTVLSDIFEINLAEDIIIGGTLNLFTDNTKILSKGRVYAHLRKGQSLTLFDLYGGAIPHQSSFIKCNLFNKYGLYDESYKIVSDWIFFLKTIGLAGVSVKYVDIVISCFDKAGISSTNTTLLNEERKEALEKMIPKQILFDYNNFGEIISQYETFDYILKYKATRFVARAINKLIRIFG